MEAKGERREGGKFEIRNQNPPEEGPTSCHRFGWIRKLLRTRPQNYARSWINSLFFHLSNRDMDRDDSFQLPACRTIYQMTQNNATLISKYLILETGALSGVRTFGFCGWSGVN